jgi:hypothetical protein
MKSAREDAAQREGSRQRRVGTQLSPPRCRSETLWCSEYHRGRRPAVWSLGEYLVIDRAQAGPAERSVAPPPAAAGMRDRPCER